MDVAPAVANGEPKEAKILFVDDDAGVTAVMRQFLPALGYSFICTDSPVAALEAFQRNPESFRLLIADLVMPDMNGQELAIEIRKIRRNFPIVFCTGYFHIHRPDIDVEHSTVLQKPFGIQELRNVIETALIGDGSDTQVASARIAE